MFDLFILQAQNSPSTITWSAWGMGRLCVNADPQIAAAFWESGQRWVTRGEMWYLPLNMCRNTCATTMLSTQNNPPSEDKGRKLRRRGYGKRKKKAVLTKEREDECFSCGDGGQMVSCKKPGCPKVYHADCLNLTKRPAGQLLQVSTSKSVPTTHTSCWARWWKSGDRG